MKGEERERGEGRGERGEGRGERGEGRREEDGEEGGIPRPQRTKESHGPPLAIDD